MATRLTITEGISDGVTPIAAYARMADLGRGPSFLLESAPGAQQTSRYSIIGIGALGEVRAVDGAVDVRTPDGTQRYDRADVLPAARVLLRELAPEHGPLGVWGRFLGAYGAAAFEFAGYLERLPKLPRFDDAMPDVHLVVPETVAVFDHFTHRAAVLTLRAGADAHQTHRDVCDALDSATIAPLRGSSTRGAIVRGAEIERSRRSTMNVDRSILSTIENQRYVRAVERAKESIVAGDVFQVVLAQRWSIVSATVPFDVYRMLRVLNPSPYMYYVDFGWGQLLGSSPEVLVRLDGRTARLRPLAGTKPRDADPDRERVVAARLRRDPKERAEHVMLVDLGRNDLGRVCEAGSVRVSDLMSVERFSHVMHLVSDVRGTLSSERDGFDLFASAFPAGTVSGAPKIRAMELIAELEGARRGFYAGSVGYFGFDGSMDACITLRSAHARNGTYALCAGAGIVADSSPESEDRECRAKAAAVFNALTSLDDDARVIQDVAEGSPGVELDGAGTRTTAARARVAGRVR